MPFYDGKNGELSPTNLDHNVAETIVINQRNQYNRYLGFSAEDQLLLDPSIDIANLVVVCSGGSCTIKEIPLEFQKRLSAYSSIREASTALATQPAVQSLTDANTVLNEDSVRIALGDFNFYLWTALGAVSKADRIYLLSTPLSGQEILGKIMPGPAPKPFQWIDTETYFLGVSRNNQSINPPLSHERLAGTANKADVLSFAHAPAFGPKTADRITNFNPKEKDRLRIQLNQFGANTKGTFKIAKNSQGLAKILATPASFVYLQSTGELFYNEDGAIAGFGNGGVFAKLEGRPIIGSQNIGFI